jgi:hypothetical protein
VLLAAAIKIWRHEGVQSLLAGLVLFQLMPEARKYLGPVQLHKWRHAAFLIGIYALMAPCFYIVFIASYRPNTLATLQDSTLVRGMCLVMGASRGVPDYYEMLGFEAGAVATQPMVKKVRVCACVCVCVCVCAACAVCVT